MSVLICGSRHPRDMFAAKLAIDGMAQRLQPGVVVLNGGAAGVDTFVLDAVRKLPNGQVRDLGTDWRLELVDQETAVTALVFRPRWKRDGKAAGVLRNLHMLDLRPEMVVAVWNGVSPGTKHVIGEARARKIETVVIDT